MDLYILFSLERITDLNTIQYTTLYLLRLTVSTFLCFFFLSSRCLTALVALLSRVTASSHGNISLNPTQRGRLCLVERGVGKDVPTL